MSSQQGPIAVASLPSSTIITGKDETVKETRETTEMRRLKKETRQKQEKPEGGESEGCHGMRTQPGVISETRCRQGQSRPSRNQPKGMGEKTCESDVR
ncbi:hypothetical protein GE061_006572 [Apolygus lucorum]|uniref:Uncharacterized protein n=1 Tax=Apolygus lucorum TaxID=248454 RepID=A0A8S9WVL3_APOLU|nr:hypothetical protein GE061_006572 [Apolygus lucorum]